MKNETERLPGYDRRSAQLESRRGLVITQEWSREELDFGIDIRTNRQRLTCVAFLYITLNRR